MEKNEIKEAILDWLEEVGDATVALLLSGGNSRRVYSKLRELEKKRLRRTFLRLQENGEIVVKKKKKEEWITLTEKGRRSLRHFKLDSMSLPKGKRWDGIWHLAIFDIPEANKAGRSALSYRLQSLGVFHLQRSVFIYPYNFRDEVQFISETFGVFQYVFYMEVKKIDIEEKLIKFFNLN